MWMNEYEVEQHLIAWDDDDHPVARAASKTLANLVEAVNSCSDGWPHWAAPAKAADRLMTLLQALDRAERDTIQSLDMTPAMYRKALTPLKSFRTKRGVDFDIEEI